MKREGQIRQQYKQVKYRIRKKLLDKNMRVEPSNCCFHAPVSVEKSSGVVLCAYKEMAEDADWDVVVCDVDQARQCDRFAPEATPDEIKSRFERFLAAAETSGNAQAIGTLAYHYPDLAALLWVLEPWTSQGETSCEECGTGGRCYEAGQLDSEGSGASSVPNTSASDTILVEDEHENPQGLEEEVFSETSSSSLSVLPLAACVAPDKVEEDADAEHPVMTSAEVLRNQERLPSRRWLLVKGSFVAAATALLFLLIYWSLSG